jgi:hypothetical protein
MVGDGGNFADNLRIVGEARDPAEDAARSRRPALPEDTQSTYS